MTANFENESDDFELAKDEKSMEFGPSEALIKFQFPNDEEE
jgi:hypothetical protein